MSIANPNVGAEDGMNTVNGKQPLLSLWRQRMYLVWLTSDTAKDMGRVLYGFALPLLVLMQTGSPSKAGVVGAVSMIANLVATVFGGVLADRRPRLRLMMVGSLVGLLISLILVAASVAGTLSFTVLLAISVAFSLRNGLFGVAAEAALKDVVPTPWMGRAQAANQGRDAVLGVIGGPLGGVLLSIGAALTAAVMAALNILAVLSAFVLNKMHGSTNLEGLESTGEDVGEDVSSETAMRYALVGLKAVWKRRDLRSAILVATVLNVGMNAFITTVIYSLQQDGFTTIEIGTLSLVMGISMLAGSLLASYLVCRVAGGWLIVAGISLTALGSIAITLTTTLTAILAVVSLSVFLLPAVNAALLGYFLVSTPSEDLGRALSAISVLAMAAMPVAPLIAGIGLDSLGRTGTLVICAVLCVVPASLAVLSPSIRAIPREGDWQSYAESQVSHGS